MGSKQAIHGRRALRQLHFEDGFSNGGYLQLHYWAPRGMSDQIAFLLQI